MAGKYQGAGEGYAKLVDKLAEQKLTAVSLELRQNILTFHQDVKPPVSTRSTEEEAAADQLKAIP